MAISGGLGGQYGEKQMLRKYQETASCDEIVLRNLSTREVLLMRKQRKLEEIENIDKVLALLESMPNVEELLNLLPTVGL